MGDSVRKFQRCRPLRGLNRYFNISILGLAPQALCFRPLRGLGPLEQELKHQLDATGVVGLVP